VQALGGFRYNRWLGTSEMIGQNLPFGHPATVNAKSVERELFGVQGASMLVTTDFLRKVGLLEERYFLYFEEQDWAVRARRHGFGMCYAPDSIVYHREGASTGGRSVVADQKSRLADYYSIRSRILFTRTFFRYALPTVYLGLMGAAVNRLRRRQPDRVWMILKLALGAAHRPSARIPDIPRSG
jgi:GT2 family glycosyltransferase